jgi:anti-sigma B factor antagonist
VSVDIQTTLVNGVTVMTCNGQITLGQSSTLFRNTLRELLKRGNRSLVLDLAGVSYLDSTGIGELVGAYTSAHNVQARIKLCAVPPKVLELLEITRLVTVFEVYPARDEAVRSFQ